MARVLVIDDDDGYRDCLVYMPEADGIETIRTLRRLAPNLLILGMTSGINGAYADAAVRAMKRFGAKAMLYKPIESGQLLAARDAVAQRAKAVR
jgi:DNA-binding NarL/FixJ family response regulator